ncbi:MAG: gliding motility-associated C-terminal domain-containing protein [Flavobacterium sp.]
MKKIILIFLVFTSLNAFSQAAGDSPCNALQLYPYTSCSNNSGAQYAGHYQSETATGANVTMTGTSTINSACTTDNETTQAVRWIEVVATTTSFTITNLTDYSGAGAATAEQRDYVVFSGSCSSLTQIACGASIPINGTLNVTGLTAGQTYFIMVSQSAAAFSGYPAANAAATCITSTVPHVPTNNACSNAFILQNNVSYTSTNADSTADGPSVCQNPGSGSVENNVWYQWCAPANWPVGQLAYLNVNNQVCNSTQGLQLSIYGPGTTCAQITAGTATSVVCQNPGATTDYNYTFTAAANQCYLIVLDGFAGTACTYDILVSASLICETPPVAPTVTVTQPTCAVNTGTIVVTAPLGASFEYSINDVVYQSGTTFSGLVPGTYNVTVRNTTTDCVSTATVVVINPPAGAPAAPTASVTVQPTCAIPTGTIVVTAPTGATIQYSIGGAYQASGTFTGLTPGSYNVTAQDTATGCISGATVLVVNPIPANPAAPTASVTVQPTCTTPTGTIVVTAPTGATIQYSVGGAYQASGTFTGLTPGSYNVTVQDTATGCISTATVLVVNPIPANPAAPTASVTVQPTCATPTGTIVVTAPTGATIQYSVGGTYQASGTFTGLTPGSYNVTAQDTATGCISTATVLVVNPIPANPAAPTASVTVQPTCTTPTGTIVVTAPTGATIQYSVGGAYQASGTFTGLTPGSYNVTVQDTATGCVSTATVLVVNPIPANPAAPTASVTVQPTCAIPTGTIVVTAPTGATIQYSVGGAYQASGTFTGLTPGSYNVTAQDTATGCISTATVLIVNPIPANPAAPTASVTVQPTCTTPTGTIVVTAPTGATIQYSIGGAYQASGTFTGLTPGSYNVTVQDTATGCISTATVLVVNPPAGAPAAPTASVTVQPTCTVPTGTITITSPLNSLLPTNLFISEVTDEDVGALTYIELFNGTGAPVNLSNYKIKVYNNGNAFTSCDITSLSGTLANNSTYVVSIGSVTNQGGVVPNLTVASCAGVNTNDNIRLTSSTDVEIDLWGRTDGINFTPSNAEGYTYRRLASAVKPSTTWNASDWTALDPQDYTNVGNYTNVAANYQYSIDGVTYQTNPVFTGLTPGSYNVTVQDTATGCISTATVLVVNPIPANPAAPTASVTVQPTCAIPTGTIVVTAPTGATIQYSVGGAYQASGTFTGLTPGSYNVTAQDTATGCISTATVLVVNPIPANPVAPTASVTVQPTCAIPTGTIVVTVPTGATIQYSIGGAYQASGTFTGLTPGSYNVTAQDTATGCISTATVLVVNPIPANPAAPTASVTVQPTCPNPTGTIVVTAPLGGTLEYSVDNGVTYQSNTTFSGLAPNNSYTIIVRDSSTGCTSSASGSIIVDAVPPSPIVSTVSGCNGASFEITASVDLGTATYEWYDSSSNLIGTTATIVITESGTYEVRATVNSCTTIEFVTVDKSPCVIPKGVSPNNDGLNDTWNLSGLNAKQVQIFNRHGIEVYSKSNYTNEWDGKTNSGDELPSATYYYVVSLPSGEVKTGWVYINREN